uniref:Taurine catabolism dioxygenase TauD, TfdA family n=1 Tax=Candidatus Kentrum sp. LPFa TaxID=2126335 RepID=A0A450VQ68_9GAMM|nr:MAG: Taurine catabolism dioxygenase TauD, TfdA family [Candidatus Kentron sp. LPFa]VFK23090.1 MAG: Taurine catabolism dioxygenase TauD, TfdA family [Candidatus Kentron sp. LPFa]
MGEYPDRRTHDIPVTEKEIEFFVRVFDNHCLPIFWKPGWIALLDNERWAHARPPFVLQAGETRKLGVMMGNPKDRVGQKFPYHRKGSGSGP